MTDNMMQSTLTFDDNIQDLPEDENDNNDQSSAIPVNLLSLNTHATNIPLTRNKTILGRASEKCTEGAVLQNPRISGTHCEISSRSMTDADAAIWIKDVSSNGVWVNGKRIPKNETIKIFDKDIISFAPGHVDERFEVPAFMLTDKRIKSSLSTAAQSPKEQQQATKRANDSDELKDAIDGQSQGPEQKKLKTDTETNGVLAKDKEMEDTAFEQEFECGVCHEIMHKPMIMQPCLHSFCRGCAKSWLKQSTMCPSCRQEVMETKRDFKLNNLIALFLKTRPHMAREDVEEDGNDSDKSDLVGRRRRRQRRYNYDDEDEEEDEEEDDEEDDANNAQNLNLQRLPPGFQGQSVICPCCDPNNIIGYICPDGVRLEPLGPDATYGDYFTRIMPQNGHTQCAYCRKHLPIIPEDLGDIANRFRCKICCIPTCGCTMRSVDEMAVNQHEPLASYLNQVEEGLIREYMRMHNVSMQSIWQEIKTGMDNGTFYYLGKDAVPNPPPVIPAAAAPDPTQDQQQQPAVDVPAADAPAAAQDQQQQPPVAAPPLIAPLIVADYATRELRARTVKSSDRLCHTCAQGFHTNGPYYQWRKSLDSALLPARVQNRSDCWYGRQCRTQYNFANRGHAERLNHICENTRR